MKRVKFLKLCCAASALLLSSSNYGVAATTVVMSSSQEFPNLLECMKSLAITQEDQKTYHDDLIWHQRTAKNLPNLIELWKIHATQQGAIALDKDAKLVRILQFEVSQRLLELTLETKDNADSVLQQHFAIDDETLLIIKEKVASLCSHIADSKDQLVICAQFLKLHKEFPNTFAYLDGWKSIFEGQSAATCRDLLIFLRQLNTQNAEEYSSMFHITQDLMTGKQAPAILALAAALQKDLNPQKVLSFLQSLDTLDQSPSYNELMQVLTIYKKLTPATHTFLEGFSHISQAGLMTLLQFQQGQNIDGLLGGYKKTLQATLGDFTDASEFNMAIGSGLPAFSKFLQLPRLPEQVTKVYADIKETLNEYEIVTERVQAFTLLLNTTDIIPLAQPYLSKGMTGNDVASVVAHLEEWRKLSAGNQNYLRQKIEDTFGIAELVSQGMIQSHHIPMIYSEVLAIWEQSLFMTFPELDTLENVILTLGGFMKNDELTDSHKGQSIGEIIQVYRGDNSEFHTLIDGGALDYVQNKPMFLRHHIAYSDAWDVVAKTSFLENTLGVVKASIQEGVENKTLKTEEFMAYLKVMPIAFKASPVEVFELHESFAWPESVTEFGKGVLFGWVAEYYFSLVNIERMRALEGTDGVEQSKRAEIVKGIFSEQGDPEKGRWSDLKTLGAKLAEEGLSGFNIARVLQSVVDNHTDVESLLIRAQGINMASLDMEDKVLASICLGQVSNSRFSFIQSNKLFWSSMKDFAIGNLVYMASKMSDEQWDMFTSEVPELMSYANFMMAHPPRHDIPDFMRPLQKWA